MVVSELLFNPSSLPVPSGPTRTRDIGSSVYATASRYGSAANALPLGLPFVPAIEGRVFTYHTCLSFKSTFPPRSRDDEQ